MEIKGRTVFISGASSGIGQACAEVFAEQGARLILLARRAEKLADVANEIFRRTGAEIYNIACDIRDYNNLGKFIADLPERWDSIDVLINNAGLALGLNKLQEGNVKDWNAMIDTNIKGLLYLSRLILPKMIHAGSGIVINIGSLAGREVYPGGNVYCATKHAVKAISRALAIDLNGTGVRITNLDPGLVETEFSLVRFSGDDENAAKIYEGYTPLTGRDIAEVALFCVTRPQHVSIQDILVTPTDQANAMVLNKK